MDETGENRYEVTIKMIVLGPFKLWVETRRGKAIVACPRCGKRVER